MTLEEELREALYQHMRYGMPSEPVWHPESVERAFRRVCFKHPEYGWVQRKPDRRQRSSPIVYHEEGDIRGSSVNPEEFWDTHWIIDPDAERAQIEKSFRYTYEVTKLNPWKNTMKRLEDLYHRCKGETFEPGSDAARAQVRLTEYFNR